MAHQQSKLLHTQGALRAAHTTLPPADPAHSPGQLHCNNLGVLQHGGVPIPNTNRLAGQVAAAVDGAGEAHGGDDAGCGLLEGKG